LDAARGTGGTTLDIQKAIADALREILGADEISFNIPPKKEMGDFSTAACLSAAKRLGRKPLDLAQEAKATLEELQLPYICSLLVTPPGFIGFKIDFPALAADAIKEIQAKREAFGSSETPEGKVLIEHTNVNPNKAMHIGHVRNAIIGDSVARILRRLGHKVEVCNYIDDTGVQVADVVVGMLYLDEPAYQGGEDMSPFWAKYNGSVKFDYCCWDLYTRVQRAFEGNEKLAARRAEVLHELEEGKSPVAKLGKELATRIVHAHLATVARLDIYYDLLNWESDILNRGFWQTAFEKLKASGGVRYEESGPNSGCWIVPFGRGVVETEQGAISEDKILLRSNGTVTYTAKDVAYQMWKLGVLGVDFLYKLWGVQPNGEELWTTAPDGSPKSGFGAAHRAINVIDTRQSYTQQIVYECLRRLGYEKEAGNSHHLAYEVVSLSAAAAAELGQQTDEEANEVAMSGRKGLGVKADDLIDTMIRHVGGKATNPEACPERSRRTGAILAASAIRYFMVRFGITSRIVFDFEEAMKTDGDTGIYLQYSHARACSILAKAGEMDLSKAHPPEKLTATEEALVSKLGEYPAALRKAAEDYSPSTLARYAFDLAVVFTSFYETPDPGAETQTPFIRISDPALRTFRLALVDAFRQVMANALTDLGMKPLRKV